MNAATMFSRPRTFSTGFLQHPAELQKLLPELSTGNQRKAVQLGVAIAKFAERPLDWEKPIKDAFAAAVDATRNSGVLAGYYTGLAAREPSAVEAFKKEAARSPVFAIAYEATREAAMAAFKVMAVRKPPAAS